MATFTKIEPRLLKFPKYLPNDLEGFMFYYPEKFPPIIDFFEEVAQKIGADSEAFKQYGDWARDELWAGFKKIKEDYEKSDQTNLEVLIDIDARFQKLYCYRFWVVNYLFPDGPLHDYYVDSLKSLIRKFIDVADEIEDFEERIVRVQRDLLQTDYADLYLQQALQGVELIERLQADPRFKGKLTEATKLIDEHKNDNSKKINEIWESMANEILDETNPASKELHKYLPISQTKMRSSLLPLFNALTHTIEFRKENIDLKNRYDQMKNRITELHDLAKSKLSTEDYELFTVSYEQARNFSMYKDIMGEIDIELLPLWFNIHDKMR